MILPFFYFQAKLGSNFRGVFPAVVNDAMFYYARINDVVNGHSSLGNAYLFEHKNSLPQQLFLAEYLLASPIKWFGLNINTAQLVYNFLLPAIAFLLTYSALFLILKSRFWSIIFSGFLFFGLYLLAFIRPISPQFNFIFWLTQFIFLWLLLGKPNSRRLLILNIINFGLLFYIYPYYWTFYLIFFAVFVVLNLIVSKYFHNPNYGSRAMLGIAVGGFILAIPYFYLNYSTYRLPEYTETLTRLGMIYTHFPSGFRIVFYTLFGLLCLVLALWKKIISIDIKAIFLVSGILASLVAVNQHLITGRNFEFSSHYDMAAVFFLIFAIAYLLKNYLEIFSNITIHRCIVMGIILLVIGLTFYGFFNYSKQVLAVINAESIYSQNYAPVFDWLNKNTVKDSVAYTNSDISSFIPVYTADNVYYIREANLFYVSDSEVFDRFILNNFFETFDKSFVIENDRAVYGVRYIDAYGHSVQANKLRRLLGLKPEPEIYLPEEAIQKVIVRAKELQKGDFAKEIKKFRIDYLVWDKNKNPEWQINSKNFIPVFQSGNLIIFKFIS